MLADDVGKRQLIALRRSFERVFKRYRRPVLQCDCSFPPHHA
jgi:hypothetical protein